MYKHIIHKQKIVLDIEEQQEAFDYQNTISRLFNNGLTSAIENILDEISSPGEVIRIESLQLELGVINKKNFGQEFEHKLLSSLRNAVIVSKSNAGNGTNNVIVTKPAVSHREAFIYFITSGRMPWYNDVRDSNAWQHTLFEHWKDEDWKFITAWLKSRYASHPGVLDRLVLQFENEFLIKLAENICPALQGSGPAGSTSWKSFINDFYKIAPGVTNAGVASIKSGIWRTVFDILFNTEDITSSDDIAVRIILSYFFSQSENHYKRLVVQANDVLQQIETTHVQEVLNAIVDLAKKGQSFHQIKEHIARTLAKDLTDAETILLVDKQVNIQSAAVLTTSTPPVISKAPVKATNGKVAKVDEDAEYVTNAGVILLHPFLGAYFADLGLLENKRFIDNEAHQRAVLLLHYLATGEKEAPEFSLLLQKILCGYPPGDTLVTSIQLSAKEIEESQQLLRTVIDYWPPLKNTSVAGFQTTFLQRDGKLSRIDSGWLLQVEQKTVDILLGKLPWGFSTIRLPWMLDMMNVEWA
ncbi:MAG TPA: contractile injection system tape measure protein [Chitinophagaceae bacterium]|nr:contractile injection system tape measure protein [Chitinophagaceae bacterium]